MRSLFIALSFSLVAAVAVASTKDNVVVEGGVTYIIQAEVKDRRNYKTMTAQRFWAEIGKEMDRNG